MTILRQQYETKDQAIEDDGGEYGVCKAYKFSYARDEWSQPLRRRETTVVKLPTLEKYPCRKYAHVPVGKVAIPKPVECVLHMRMAIVPAQVVEPA